MRMISLLAVLAASVLAGCTASGSAYTRSAAPTDEASVVFYRPPAFAGSAVDIMLVDNGAQIGRIQNGQFINYVAAPGMHKFHTDTMAIDKEIEYSVEAGETYYVRLGLRQGMWTGTWFLSRVFEDEALAELKECCKSGD